MSLSKFRRPRLLQKNEARLQEQLEQVDEKRAKIIKKSSKKK